MKGLLVQFLRSLAESLRDRTPIIGVIGLFQVVILGQPIPDLLDLLWGSALVVLGLSLFMQGRKRGLFPLDETMAWDFARKGSLMWLFLFVFALGFSATMTEPALIAVTDKAAAVAAAGHLIEPFPVAQDDSGGVTTSTITVPLVAALGVGLAASIEGRNPLTDGFGLIAVAALAPIVFVLGDGALR